MKSDVKQTEMYFNIIALREVESEEDHCDYIEADLKADDVQIQGKAVFAREDAKLLFIGGQVRFIICPPI